MRGVNLDMVERLKDERARNLQQRAADYKATEPDQLSQRFREAENLCSNSRQSLTWRGRTVQVWYDLHVDDGYPVYELDGIYDCEWMDIVDQVTSSELDDLERQLFNLDNLARYGL